MIALYIAYALLSFLFNIFVIVTSPLWALIAAAFKLEVLPSILKWVHTHDNNIYGGPMPTSFIKRFTTAVWWLCRNPGYNFDALVLGFKSFDIKEQIDETNYLQWYSVTGYDWDDPSAYHYAKITLNNGKKRFSYRKNVPLWGDRYIKVWFGWHYFDQAGYRMLKFDINPFKGS